MARLTIKDLQRQLDTLKIRSSKYEEILVQIREILLEKDGLNWKTPFEALPGLVKSHIDTMKDFQGRKDVYVGAVEDQNRKLFDLIERILIPNQIKSTETKNEFAPSYRQEYPR